MKGTLLFKTEDYSLYKEKGISTEVVDFLDSINWGGDGAKYEHKNTDQMVPLLADPSLICIRKEDELLSTAVFCHVKTKVRGKSYSCHYIRYFAASPKIRGKGLVKKLGTQVMELIREGEEEKTLYYAYVEAANKHSYSVVNNAGYYDIGLIQTTGFSRFFPKSNKNITAVKSQNQKNRVLDLLYDFYKDHGPVHFESLFINDQYFVIEEDGEIIAGCQYHKVHWAVHNVPGLMGKILMNVVPHLPVFNKLFNPKKFEFLAFEGIYFKEGNENRLAVLFEALLARENLKSAMMWHGADCPIYAAFKSKCDLGILDRFVKDTQARFMISHKNLDDSEIQNIKECIPYTSAFDFI